MKKRGLTLPLACCRAMESCSDVCSNQGLRMTKIVCPDCGFVHECESNFDVPRTTNTKASKMKASKGYSLYYVPCRCGCGCGHTCGLMYGPYGKAHNAKGKAALQGEVGKQIQAIREASAKVRKEHMNKIHEAT